VSLFERQLDFSFDILAAHPHCAATPARASSGAAKQALEEIAEAGSLAAASEDFGKVPETAAARGLPSWRRREIRTGMPVRSQLIVLFSFLGVRKDLIGFVDVLELFLCGFVPLIHIRMKFASELAVLLADVLSARRSRDAEDLVIIFVFDGHRTLRLACNPDSCRPQQFVAQPISALHLLGDCARRVCIARDRADGFVHCRIKRLAHGLHRGYGLLLQQFEQPAVNRLHTLCNG
jgi:hypothetical protein